MTNITVSDSTMSKDMCLPQRMRILGVPVDILSMEVLVQIIESWIQARDRSRWIACTNSHGIIEATRDAEFKQVLESADLSVPDGYRLVRIARQAGYSDAEHLTAPDLMLRTCELGQERGYRMFFYGDTEQVLDILVRELTRRYPKLNVAGTISPPFRPLSDKEEAAYVEEINSAKPDILWVGLGLPKQERWISRNVGYLRVPVTIAVGATFKFHSGMVPRAPKWMVTRGWEWVWRFSHEPRRLFKRVIIYGPIFLVKSRLENWNWSRSSSR